MQIRRAAALLAALCLLLAACGAGASTMHLRRTEGQVGVSDGEKAVEPAEDLSLFSGYGVDTAAASYAWIDLDAVKLTKLDENSEIAIVQDGKHLTIDVTAGSLFFEVTEPLADDEAMEIRTSTMAVGIRGTCGWVEVPDPAHLLVFLLEGKVKCEAGEEWATVRAGDMAVLTEEGAIQVSRFTAEDIPAFVRAELEADTDLAAAVLADAGLDISSPPPEEAPPEEAPAEEAPEEAPAKIPPRPSQITSYREDGTPVIRHVYTYDDTAGGADVVSYLWVDGQWTQPTASRQEADYDSQGRELEVRTYAADGTLRSRVVLLDADSDYAHYGSNPQDPDYDPATALPSYTVYYGAQGQKLRTEMDDQSGYYLFEYDDQGRIVRETSYSPDGTVLLASEYEYE